MQFLYEWLAIGVKLENLHFIFAGIRLNKNFAHVIPDVHLISGLQLFNFLESQQDPWDYPLLDDTSAVMRVFFLGMSYNTYVHIEIFTSTVPNSQNLRTPWAESRRIF
jgi:hypothetical protein